MITSREAIMTALGRCLSQATFSTPINGQSSWALISRRVRLWSDVPAADQPALFIAEHGETIAYSNEGAPGRAILNVDLFVYLAGGKDPGATPASDINIVLDALFSALAPEPTTGRQTLGGLVHHCRIEGRIVKDPGDLDGQGLALVPVKILAP
jgi:hypothetical protein